MKEKTELRLIFYFTLAYLFLFTIISLVKKNYEFVYYIVVLVALLFIVVLYHKRFHLTAHVLIGLTVLGVLHLVGGNVYVFGTRLYDLWLIPPNIFKFDNLVHAFATFVATFVVYNLLHPHLDRKIHHQPVLLSLLLVSITMGLGAFNEVIELVAVVTLDVGRWVGDYLNNALDLFFNLLGSIFASFFIVRYHKKIPKKKK